jgi:hypothetical protein
LLNADKYVKFMIRLDPDAKEIFSDIKTLPYTRPLGSSRYLYECSMAIMKAEKRKAFRQQ